jgi:acetyl esterase
MENPMSRWMSQVAGHEVVVSFPQTVDDLLTDRPQNRFVHLNVDLPDLGAFHEHVVLRAAPERELTAEVSVPHGEPTGVLLFLHGGAWYRGSAEDERKLAMQLAESGLVVVNFDYALAPEYPFPAALDDIAFATRWIAEHAAGYGADGSRLVVGGASAGANLAAAAVTRAEDPSVYVGLLLLYGIFDLHALAMMDPNPLFDAYIGSDWAEKLDDPQLSPIKGDLSAFPSTYVSCGAEDVGLQLSLQMLTALVEAGVPTTGSIVAEADHVFLNIPDVIPGAVPELARIRAWLAERAGATDAVLVTHEEAV